MDVLVLGAGCSKSYSQSPTGCRMPVARDFFSTFHQLDISANPWVLIGNIVNVARDRFGISPIEFDRVEFDIEEFHSMVEQELLDLLRIPEPQRTREQVGQRYEYWKAYTELVFLFASVVNEIQNGPSSIAHQRLAEALGEHDQIITFNWDTLMDRALTERRGWRVDAGYSVQPRQVFQNGWRGAKAEAASCGIKLLKLHGSSNWLSSAPVVGRDNVIALTQRADPSDFWIYESANQPYDTYDGRYMPGYSPFSYGYYPPNIQDDVGQSAPDGQVFVRFRYRFPWRPKGQAGQSGLISMPLLIPPVKKKQYALFGSLFEQLWNKAADALVACDRIVLIGYSFPRTDHKSNELFFRAFLKRQQPPHVVIVDPAPERIHHKFTHEFGVPESNVRVFAEYWTEDSDPARLFE